ncbi:MAG: sigma-54-dependent Fis family transcriptional regulator [Acidimicrobiia bacterium]|nr:sigma-54-dependent Fis family transcriptional regulator [Acidimicrobiia bacterium]
MRSSATRVQTEVTRGALQPRRADPRDGFEAIASALGRAVARGGVASLRAALEESLQRVLRARTVYLRRAALPAPRESLREKLVCVEVPVRETQSRAVLQCAFSEGATVGDWELQTLRIAAQVASLVVELDRSQMQLARASQGTRPERDGAAPLIGSTAAMADLRSRVERVANTPFTVLIEGESGVGKELVARQIHDLSPRRGGPFVAVNCAAIVETLVEAELFGIEDRTATGVRGRRGKFEHADGGTLFLDEISDLSCAAQAKLLRAIQERVGGHGAHRVDVRIVAATNRGLSGLVDRQLFRPDLFYRLAGVEVHVPPLRERRADILELARYFLERHRAEHALRLSPAASEALLAYDWPGNVRELQRLIERAVALAESDVIELHDLPAAVRGHYAEVLGPSLRRSDTMRAWGARYARLILGRCHGNKREACRVLDISYHTLGAYLQYRAPGEPAEAVDAATSVAAAGGPHKLAG